METDLANGPCFFINGPINTFQLEIYVKSRIHSVRIIVVKRKSNESQIDRTDPEFLVFLNEFSK